jgi:hypothetical protein
MLEEIGDIWDYYNAGCWIVITTNGNVRSDGEAVMGRGIAFQAKQHLPELPKMLAANTRALGASTFSFSQYHLFTLATKYNWWEKSNIELIRNNVCVLRTLAIWYTKSGCSELSNVFPVYLPRLGCSNGGLHWESDVRPFLSKYLDDRFIVINRSA